MTGLRRWVLRAVAAGVALLLGLGAFVMVAGTREGVLPDAAPGFSVSHIAAAHRPGGLDLHLWYPASADVAVTLIGQNALFYGFHARRDAPGDGGRHPVVVLSHGSGGNAERLGWIATELALRGMIVAAVNHPGTTSRDSLPARTVMPWERTADLTAVLDFLAGDPGPGLQPDLTRVGVLGFSLGGGTALLSSGARLSKDAFTAYCAANAGQQDCGWLAAGGVDFATIDAVRYEADLRDPRVGVVVAVDPALSQAMTGTSLAAMALPVLIVNLGAPDDIPAAMRSDALAARIPGARYLSVPGAWHFSFLARCSLFGKVMIGLAGDDNICAEAPGGRDRAAVQTDLAAEIGNFLQERLQDG